MALLGLLTVATFRAEAQFRNLSDRAVVKDVLGLFGRECGLRIPSEQDTIRRLEAVSQTARNSKNEQVQKCYQSNYSQIVGVASLYEKLCRDVSAIKDKVNDLDLASQLMRVSRYQSGIRPFHSLLNDCLTGIPNREGVAFVVPLTGSELNIELLKRELEQNRPTDPYPPTPEPFR